MKTKLLFAILVAIILALCAQIYLDNAAQPAPAPPPTETNDFISIVENYRA